MGGRTLFTLGLMATLCAQGCASVTVPIPYLGGGDADHAQVVVQEREALKAATVALDAEAPDEITATERMSFLFFGGGNEADEEALNAYLDGLSGPEPQGAVMADVDAALQRARDVAEVGRRASTALVPTMDDVVLLEAAITDVQRCKRRYVAALRTLRDRGEAIDKAEIRQVRDAFMQSARDIGTAADLVAARLDAAPERLAETEGGVGVGF